MKSILLAASATLLLAGAAQAADALAPAAFDWTGAYVGVNAGGGWGKSKHTYTETYTASPGIQAAVRTSTDHLDVDVSGFLGGVQAGYNWQSGQVVYGVETDFQGAAIDGSYHENGETWVKTKVDWYGTLRGRIGFTPVDRFLVYGTGGLAYGHFKTTAWDGDMEGSKTRAGWALGAGAEYAITSNWTVKTEYLYVDLGKATMDTNNYEDGKEVLKSSVSFNTVRVGLNYKF